MTEFSAPPRLHVLHVPGADPQRDEIVARLVEQGDACLHLDPGRRGIMSTWLEAVACAATESNPWAVIVQDDADPLRGWQQHLERACTNSPQPVLGLTYFGQYGSKAAAKGAPFAEGRNLIWGGAVAYHHTFLQGLAEWAPRVVEQTDYPHDDRLVAAYAMKRGHRTALVSRAIFDQPVAQSLVGHNTRIRTPALTILNEGPVWSSRPRSVNVSAGVDKRIPELAQMEAL